MPPLPHTICTQAGMRFLVRQVTADDRDLLLNALNSVSRQTLYYRFLSNKSSLTSADLDYLLDVDQDNHVAIGAVTMDQETPSGAGIARYVRDDQDASRAYLGLAVHDWFQKQGIGRHLLITLAQNAQSEGIDLFVARMHPQQYSLRKRALQIEGARGQLDSGMITTLLPTRSLTC